ncbi:transcriptional regulator, RpiR family [Pseudomonas guineae]|uniref:Transcriptional regulator, RpiR family n=2 Tax=Pseudomonas guineae TaxID=425504 RepID=A0A1I3JHT7_9PSED|nr:transcriptional regulator, RpiR family [Pseudomonas guineae]
MPLPQTLVELRSAIALGQDKLTARMRDAAHYLIEHPHDVALNTLAALAKRSAIPASAFIRLAQALGYGGFSDLQRVFKAPLEKAGQGSFKERIRHYRGEQLLDDPTDIGAMLSAFSQANIVSLEHLAEGEQVQALEQSIALLQKARTTFVVGMRRSFPMAAYLSYALSRVGRRAVHISGLGGSLREQVGALHCDDVLVAVSFPPYAQETIDACEQAVAAGTPIVAITDSILSPVGQCASVMIEVNDAELLGFRSLTAAFCIAQTLAMGLAFGDGQTFTGPDHEALKDIDC